MYIVLALVLLVWYNGQHKEVNELPIVYNKLFQILKDRGKTMYDLRKDKVIGTATLEKMRKAEGHIDTRSIEKLCEYLKCQPGDIMEFVEDE